MKITREVVIDAARIYAADVLRAVKIFEVVLPEWAHEMYVSDPGSKPVFISLNETCLDKTLPEVMKLLPRGSTLREIYRATPPQWN